MGSIYCSSCQLETSTEQGRKAHYASAWHRYNVKRKVAELPSLSLDLFERKLAAAEAEAALQTTTSHYCSPCKSTFKSSNSYQHHVQSKKHKQRAEAPQAAKPSPEAGESYPDGIPIGHCLFCTSQFDSIDACVKHMRSIHSFSIPFPEFLVDQDGLLSYLGAKIGVGHVCLYCNGKVRAAYPTMQAVRQHMVDKSHCKLLWNDTDDDFEFDEFYDFSSGVDSERFVASLNDLGELVLNDGTLIGTRELAVYYKQHYSTPNPIEEQCVNNRLGITAGPSQTRAQHRQLTAPRQPQLSKKDKIIVRKAFAVSNKTRLDVEVKQNKFQPHFRSQIN